MQPLNDLLPDLALEHGFSRPHLKMDTQGFDNEVFQGADSVHDRFVSLQSELSVKRLYADVPRWTDMLATY